MSTTKTYATLSIEEAAREAAERGAARRGTVAIRRDLGIGSFGVNAFYQGEAGERVIGEHNELNPGANGQEELYVVLSGSCTFTIDGETVDAPAGTAVFVADAAATRSAVADVDDTTVLVVGGRPGEPYVVGPGGAMGTFFELYGNKDYAGALAACKGAFDMYPGNALVLYNVACMESLLGHADASLAALAESVEKWPRYKELAAGDDDFAPLRDDPRFQALIA